MGSYEEYAWNDAVAIAYLIDEMHGYTNAKKTYALFTQEAILEFEEKHEEFISDFIRKTETQRVPFLRRITKNVDDNTNILFLTLALIGVLRARDVLELRDQYRHVLVPGQGNRVTVAGIYDFASELSAIYDYAWPSEPFEAIDVGLTADDDEDEDEENKQ